MSKTDSKRNLVIVRHGKSTWDFSGVQDIDRPLIEKGILATHLMAETYSGKYPRPDLILSSPAARALHTAMIFMREFDLPAGSLRIEPSLYMVSEDHVLSLLEAIDDAVLSVMIFGHNPCFTDLANHFLQSKVENIPTSGLVRLTFSAASWADISAGTLVGVIFDFPKKHID